MAPPGVISKMRGICSSSFQLWILALFPGWKKHFPSTSYHRFMSTCCMSPLAKLYEMQATKTQLTCLLLNPMCLAQFLINTTCSINSIYWAWLPNIGIFQLVPIRCPFHFFISEATTTFWMGSSFSGIVWGVIAVLSHYYEGQEWFIFPEQPSPSLLSSLRWHYCSSVSQKRVFQNLITIGFQKCIQKMYTWELEILPH